MMENAKQKAIRLAYGEYWEEVKDYVNSNGWVKESIWEDFSIKPNIDMQDGSIGILRPITLQGIENNLGWIKIESKEDFPIGRFDFYEASINLENCYGLYIRNEIIDMYRRNIITHYKPFNYSQKPIY